MTFPAKAWVDSPLTTTPITAAALIDIETRVTDDARFDATRDYGCTADGTTDDTTALQNAVDAAYAAGGGRVDLPSGTIICSGLIIKTNVHLHGQGIGATILKLPDSGNEDVIISQDFAVYTGGTTRGGPDSFGLHDLTVDGNKANNTIGYCMRVFGSAYIVENVEFQNGDDGGVWSEWGTGGTDMEAHWSGFTIHDCSGDGLTWKGPHDSQFVNGKVFKNNGRGIKTLGNATSEQFSNIHVWGTEHSDGWNFAAPAYCVNCVAEGATDANLVIDCNFGSWVGGAIFGTNTSGEIGIQVGDSTTARYWVIDWPTMFNFVSGGKPINYVSTSRNHIAVNCDNGTLSQVVYGTPSNLDHIDIWCGADPALATNSSDRIIMGNTRIYSDASTKGLHLGVAGNENYIDFLESSAVSAPSANSARLTCRDNGSGKSQLVVRFPSGAVQVLATEP